MTRLRGAAPGAELPLGERGGVRVVLDADREAEALPRARPRGRRRRAGGSSRAECARCRGRGSTGCRSRSPRRGRRAAPRRPRRAPRGAPPPTVGAVRLDRSRDDRAVAIDEPGEDLRPADVDPDDEGSGHGAGYHTGPNGRRRQALPGVSRRPQEGQGPARADATRPTDATPERAARQPRRRAPRRAARWIGLTLVLRSSCSSPPGASSATSRSRAASTRRTSGVPAASRRSSPSGDGSLLSNPTTILVARHRRRRRRARGCQSLGLDHARSAPIPGSTGVSYLSIPRDLRVEIPGYGTSQDQRGVPDRRSGARDRDGRALTGLADRPRRGRRLRRLPRAHRLARRDRRRRPEADPLEPFDCPYKTAAQCARLGGLALREGRAAHGRPPRARLLADPHEPARPVRDGHRPRAAPAAGRAGDARTRSRASGTFAAPAVQRRRPRRARSPPTSRRGSSLQLGWVRFRADSKRSLHCRLGGEPATIGGESVILGSEDNVATVAMFPGARPRSPPPRALPRRAGTAVSGTVRGVSPRPASSRPAWLRRRPLAGGLADFSRLSLDGADPASSLGVLREPCRSRSSRSRSP